MAKKKKGQKDKQRSTKHTHKTKDRVTRTLLKTGEWTQVLRKGRQFLLHKWHPLTNDWFRIYACKASGFRLHDERSYRGYVYVRKIKIKMVASTSKRITSNTEAEGRNSHKTRMKIVPTITNKQQQWIKRYCIGYLIFLLYWLIAVFTILCLLNHAVARSMVSVDGVWRYFQQFGGWCYHF